MSLRNRHPPKVKKLGFVIFGYFHSCGVNFLTVVDLYWLARFLNVRFLNIGAVSSKERVEANSSLPLMAQGCCVHPEKMGMAEQREERLQVISTCTLWN